MIVINQKYGQLGNQLFLYAHIMAYAIECRRKVFYPGFSENNHFFPNLQKPFIDNILFGSSISPLFSLQIYRFLRRFFYFNSKPMRLLEKTLGRRIHLRIEPLTEFFYPDLSAGKNVPNGFCFFEGWAFRVHKTFQKHHKQLQELFRFSDNLRSASRETLDKVQCKIKIGVHIRMGDYKKLAPQWVYPKKFWHDAMNKLRDELGSEASFFVVSDDNEIDFPEKWISRYRGSFQSDMALLSECDYILGPPSTFNRWAAFIGGKPHYCVWNFENIPSVENFAHFKLCLNSPLEMTEGELEEIRWFGIA